MTDQQLWMRDAARELQLEKELRGMDAAGVR